MALIRIKVPFSVFLFELSGLVVCGLLHPALDGQGACPQLAHPNGNSATSLRTVALLVYGNEVADHGDLF